MGGYKDPAQAEADSPYAKYTPPGHEEGASPSNWERQNQRVSGASNSNDSTSQAIEAGQYAQTKAQQEQYAKVTAAREANAAAEAERARQEQYAAAGLSSKGVSQKQAQDVLSMTDQLRAMGMPVGSRDDIAGAMGFTINPPTPEKEIVTSPIANSALPKGVVFTGQISKDPSDIKAPFIGPSFGGIKEKNDWVEKLPVGVGDILNLVGVAKPIQEAFPVSSFKETEGWSLGNIPHALASREILTDTYSAPVTDKAGVTTQEVVTTSETFRSPLNMAKREAVEGTYGKVLPEFKEAPVDPKIHPTMTQQGVLHGGNIAGGVYNEFRDNPDTLLGNIAVGAGVGFAFGTGEALAGNAIAKAAVAKPGLVQTVGKAASTPLAGDLWTVAKVGMGGLFVKDTGERVIGAESDLERGKILAGAGAQVAGFAMGAGAVNVKPVDNPMKGVEFFSGKPAMGPIEKVTFSLETTARSQFTSNPGAYRDVSTIVKPGRFVEPQVKAEPVISELSGSGKYASEIKDTMMEQEHSMIGSGSVRQQYSPDIVAKTGLRVGKDADVLFEKPTEATSSLAKKAGVSLEESKGLMDVHPIPKNYPLKASAEADLTPSEGSPLTNLFGDPYRKLATPRSSRELIQAGKDYSGKITYEGSQVQFGRKADAVASLIENPIVKGYRGQKDVYDFLTEYEAQKAVSISRGEPASNFKASDAAVKDLMGREITRGTTKFQRAGDGQPTVTETIGDMYKTMQKKGGYESAVAGVDSRIPVQGSVVKAAAAPASAFPSAGALATTSMIASNSLISGAPTPAAPVVLTSARITSSPEVGAPSLFGSPIFVQGPSSGLTKSQEQSMMVVPEGGSDSEAPLGSPVLTKSPSSGTGRFSISPPKGSSVLFGSPKGSPSKSEVESPLMKSSSMFDASSMMVGASLGSGFSPSPFKSSFIPIGSVVGSPSQFGSSFGSPSPSPYPSPYPSPSPSRYPYPSSVTPTPPIPAMIPDGLPFFGGGGSGPSTRKRSTHFVETFMVGLDMSVKRRSKAAGKSFTSPAPRKKSGGKKRKK